MIFDFLKRKKWEKLGTVWTSSGVKSILNTLKPKEIHFRDRDYRALPVKDFEQIIFDSWFPNDEPAYKSEIFDCDDFAVCFMADIKRRWANISHGQESLAFGYIAAIIEGLGNHAFIWQMDDDGNVNFYEPQTGKRIHYKLLSVSLVES